MSVATKKSLTPAQQWLLERMQQMDHGSIYNLEFRDGQPMETDEKDGKCRVRFGSKSNADRKTTTADFVLKAQHMELFDFMQRKQNGTINVLEIKHGLPFGMEFDEEP